MLFKQDFLSFLQMPTFKTFIAFAWADKAIAFSILQNIACGKIVLIRLLPIIPRGKNNSQIIR